MPAHRFPATPESFIVRDATGQVLGYFYFDDERSAPISDAPADAR